VSTGNHEASHYAVVSSLRSSFRRIMRDKISHPYNTTRKVTDLCILYLYFYIIFIIVYIILFYIYIILYLYTRKDKIPWAKKLLSIRQILYALSYCLHAILIDALPKYLNSLLIFV